MAIAPFVAENYVATPGAGDLLTSANEATGQDRRQAASTTAGRRGGRRVRPRATHSLAPSTTSTGWPTAGAGSACGRAPAPTRAGPPEWTAAQYCEELERVRSRFTQMTGQPMAPIFRAPGGKTSPALLAAAQPAGSRACPGARPASSATSCRASATERPAVVACRATCAVATSCSPPGHLVAARDPTWASADLEPLIVGLKARRPVLSNAARLRPQYGGALQALKPDDRRRALFRGGLQPAGSRVRAVPAGAVRSVWATCSRMASRRPAGCSRAWCRSPCCCSRRAAGRLAPGQTVTGCAAVRVDVLYLIHRLGFSELGLFVLVQPLWDHCCPATLACWATADATRLDAIVAAVVARVTGTVWFRSRSTSSCSISSTTRCTGPHGWRWWWTLHALHHGQRQMTMWATTATTCSTMPCAPASIRGTRHRRQNQAGSWRSSWQHSWSSLARQPASAVRAHSEPHRRRPAQSPAAPGAGPNLPPMPSKPPGHQLSPCSLGMGHRVRDGSVSVGRQAHRGATNGRHAAARDGRGFWVNNGWCSSASPPTRRRRAPDRSPNTLRQPSDRLSSRGYRTHEPLSLNGNRWLSPGCRTLGICRPAWADDIEWPCRRSWPGGHELCRVQRDHGDRDRHAADGGAGQRPGRASQVLSDQMATTLDQAISNVAGARSSSTGWSENSICVASSRRPTFATAIASGDPSRLGGRAYLSNVDPSRVLGAWDRPARAAQARRRDQSRDRGPQAAPSYGFEQAWVRGTTRSRPSTPPARWTLPGACSTCRPVVRHRRLLGRQRLQPAPSSSRPRCGGTDPSTQLNLATFCATGRRSTSRPSCRFDTTTRQFQWATAAPTRRRTGSTRTRCSPGSEWLYRLNADWQIKAEGRLQPGRLLDPAESSTAWGPMSLVGDTWVIGLNSAQLDGTRDRRNLRRPDGPLRHRAARAPCSGRRLQPADGLLQQSLTRAPTARSSTCPVQLVRAVAGRPAAGSGHLLRQRHDHDVVRRLPAGPGLAARRRRGARRRALPEGARDGPSPRGSTSAAPACRRRTRASTTRPGRRASACSGDRANG